MKTSLPDSLSSKNHVVIFRNDYLVLHEHEQETKYHYPLRGKEHPNGIENDWDLFRRVTDLEKVGSRQDPYGRLVATLMNDQGEMFECFYSCSWEGTKTINW